MTKIFRSGVASGSWREIVISVILALLLATLPSGWAGGTGLSQEEADQASQQLERLRQEIQEFEKRISESQNREKNLLGELEDFDREIALRLELIQKLEQERNRAQRSLEATQRELGLLQVEIGKTRSDSIHTAQERDSLAALVSRRAIYTYKHLQRDVLKAILTSHSVVQMLTRQEYIKRIAAADRRNLLYLDQKNQKLIRLGNELAERQNEQSVRLERYRKIAQYKNELIEEGNSEAELLKKRRQDRESLLKRIRQDQDLLRTQLADKKLAAQRIESLIKSLEARRESLPTPPGVTWAPAIPFSQLRGKLNWPTLGRVVSRFGLQRHQKLATVTENPGIEIEAKEGTPVSSVCTGQITKITWLRGYGNTVIMDHHDGYYTVYAHLGQILVREGQIVSGGEMIGRVGQSGSLSGPRLHFEVWAKREKQDPITWLVPR